MSLYLPITPAQEGRRGILPAQYINLPLTKVSLPGIRKYPQPGKVNPNLKIQEQSVSINTGQQHPCRALFMRQ